MVIGEPVGKARPVVTRYHAFTPKKTLEAEEMIRNAYLDKYDGVVFPEGIPLNLSVRAFFKIAPSNTKKTQEAKRNGFLRPTKKPDGDNILKLVADALNTYAYKDDSQIVEMNIDKWYSDEPRLEIVLADVSR